MTKLVLPSQRAGKAVIWVLYGSSAIFRTFAACAEICLSKLYVRIREWILPDQYNRDESVLFCVLQMFTETWAEEACISMGRLSKTTINCSGMVGYSSYSYT